MSKYINDKIYLDYAATTPVDERVFNTMRLYFTENFGNPSSFHSLGQEARIAIEKSRQIIANSIGAEPEEIVFTSGGTESNNFAIKGIAYRSNNKGNHIITTSIEHHAVLNPCKFLEKFGFDITYLPVDRFGMVDPDDVKKAIKPGTILITVMHANNEIGTIQPIKEIGKIAREHGIPFHTDAVQTFGHLRINVKSMNIDMLSASAHKLYGPKGVGFLYIKGGLSVEPFLHGGSQEGGRRGSTHNVPGIVGLGKAVEIAMERMDEEAEYLTFLRDYMIGQLTEKIDGVFLNGHPVIRLPNNVNLSVNYVEGESILVSLDINGIACSTGSACSSQSLEPSHVLKAIGIGYDVAHSSVRFSLGRFTKREDIERVIEVMPGIVKRLRAISPLCK